jgi:hypothetical protein
MDNNISEESAAYIFRTPEMEAAGFSEMLTATYKPHSNTLQETEILH